MSKINTNVREVVVMLKLNQKSSIHEEPLMEEDQIIVVDDELSSIAKKLDTLGQPNEADNFTIFPVPYKFRQSKENLFEPSVISIGPFHHGKTGVEKMEEQKWRFLRDFLSRGDHISLDLCLLEIKKLEERTRRCYSESVPLNSNSFVLMMLLDGCFVFEYIFQWYTNRFKFFSHSIFLVRDLLLIENQIPFFIVEKLFEIGINQGDRRDFANFIVKYFAPAVYELDYTIVSNPIDTIHHLVHLKYYKLVPINPSKPVVLNSESFFPSMLSRIKKIVLAFPLWMLTRIFPKRNSLSSFPNPFLKYMKSSFMIPCATELQNAGIKLRPKSNPAHMLDISFINDVLEIPTLTISSDDTTTLANLIAFEQYNLDKLGSNLSSFALFMVSLANTKANVMLLQQCGIINYFSDSESPDDIKAEELTNFFKQISKGMIVEQNHYMAELFTAVNKYCESSWGRLQARWNKHITEFVRTYFSSPWTKISLITAGFVVLLTVVQSFYAVYAYYVPPS